MPAPRMPSTPSAGESWAGRSDATWCLAEAHGAVASRPSMIWPLRELIMLCLTLAPMVATAQEPRPETDWEEADQQFEAFRRTRERPPPGEPACLPQNPNRVHKARRLTLYQDATDKVLEVYVSGGVATILRLPAQLRPLPQLHRPTRSVLPARSAGSPRAPRH